MGRGGVDTSAARGETLQQGWKRVRGDGPRIKNHTTTLVGSRLYVFGGYDGRLNHNQVHEFDCNKLEWRRLQVLGDPPKGRNGHTATLAEGSIYVVGGWLGAGPLAAADLHVLDLQGLRWLRPSTRGAAPGACNMHTTDYVASRRSLFVFRGGDGRRYLNDLHLLDIDVHEWSQPEVTGTPPAPRANHSSALVGEKLYVFGGWDGSKRLNDIHVLDTTTLTWSAPRVLGHAPSPRAGMSLTCVRGMLYLFGGSGPQATCFNDLQIFDPATCAWLNVRNGGRGDRSFARATTAAAALAAEAAPPPAPQACSGDGGDGGDGDNPNNSGPHGAADVFVDGHGPSQRAGHTTTLVGRKLVVFGGSLADKYLGDMFVLDTDPVPELTLERSLSSQHRLAATLPGYFNSPTFSDITFLVEGRRIYGHKMILSLASERFQSMFGIGQDGACFLEAQQKEIVINDVSYQAFFKTIQYLYTGDFEPPRTRATASLGGDAGAPARRGSAPTDRATWPDGSAAEGTGPPAPRGFHEDEDDDPERHSVSPNPFTEGDMLVGGSPEEVDQERMSLLGEMLSVADRFMLDHLKQLCEKRLAAFLCAATVEALHEQAEMSNAVQLSKLCLHFCRHLVPPCTEEGDSFVFIGKPHPSSGGDDARRS